MRGHTHRRGSTWTYVVDCGRDPKTRVRKQLTRGGFASKKSAEAALAEVLQSLGAGAHVAPDLQTVGEWIDS